MEKYLPDANFFIGKDIPGSPGYKIVKKIGSGQKGHVFKAHSERMNHDLACKVIPRANLKAETPDNPGWRQEFLKPNILDSQSVVKIINAIEWPDKESNINCVALISEFIPGKNLKDHIAGKQYTVEIHFIERFLKDMMSLFYSMEQRGFLHGDLHDKNILVEDLTGQLGGEKYRFRVTDFGVTAASNDMQPRDDYEQLAFILQKLLSKVDFQRLNPRDKFVYNLLNNEFLARHFTEKDTTRDPLARSPKRLHEKLDQIDKDYNIRLAQDAQTRLLTPFDYLSCEQIGESHNVLNALYSNLFLGLQDIESRNNLVLTGPRGCGKSTVFKSLSLEHRFQVKKDDPGDIRYIGIYYRCDDLYAAFPRYRLPEQGENFYNIPVHYLTVTLIREVLKTIEAWGRLHFKEEFSRREVQISSLVWDSLKHPRILKPQEPGADSFKALISRLEKERGRIHKKHIQLIYKNPGVKAEYLFGPEILIRVCDILIDNFSFLRERPFYFFVDDYSLPKISESLQRNLNRLLMQRTSVVFFKLSTESPVSYCRSDIDDKEYVEGREFKLVNLGLVYLAAKHQDKFTFLDDVFSRRFVAVDNYPVQNLDELIGNYDLPSYNEIARKIREEGKNQEWGKKMLFELCSGDIFYIIELVGKMVLKAGGIQSISANRDTPKIRNKTQIDAIREEAGIFLDNLSRIEGGENLVKVVTAFGNVAHSYLRYRSSKNIANKPPYQAIRIEPMEEPNFAPEAQKIYKNLLRYSLFIEDPRGKSIRGKVVPRLYLRRSLIPFFNLTFSTRDSLRLDNKYLELLFLDPVSFEKIKIIKNENYGENENDPKLPFPGIGGHDDYQD
jgi:serine/threonine protein kinase